MLGALKEAPIIYRSFFCYIPNPICPSGTNSFLRVRLTTTVFWLTQSSQVITFGPGMIAALGVVRLPIGL